MNSLIICNVCKTNYSTKSNLVKHQKNTKTHKVNSVNVINSYFRKFIVQHPLPDLPYPVILDILEYNKDVINNRLINKDVYKFNNYTKKMKKIREQECVCDDSIFPKYDEDNPQDEPYAVYCECGYYLRDVFPYVDTILYPEDEE